MAVTHQNRILFIGRCLAAGPVTFAREGKTKVRLSGGGLEKDVIAPGVESAIDKAIAGSTPKPGAGAAKKPTQRQASTA